MCDRKIIAGGGSPGVGSEGLAIALRAVYPEASPEVFRDLLASRVPGRALSDKAVAELYEQAAPESMPLVDRGYVAGVHPLELWLAGYLRRHPGAGMGQVVRASAAERQAVYSWLFFTRHRNAQDHRIASLLELEAFLDLHRSWERLGYPFASLTPSLATAIGSSGDRPAALAELMGIILNNGVRQPTVLIDGLDFAAGTPYETRMGRVEIPPSQVLAPEVATVAILLIAALKVRFVIWHFMEVRRAPLALRTEAGRVLPNVPRAEHGIDPNACAFYR